VTWSSDHAGSGTATISGGSNWTTGTIALDPGNNIVTVKAQDAGGNIAVKILRVIYNISPVVAPLSITTQKETGATVNVLETATDSDAQPQILRVSTVGSPGHGTAGIYDGKVRYMPAAGYSGGDSFSYTVTDGLATAMGQINVQVTGTMTNPGPVYFSQDFSAGSNLTAYYSASSPASNQFNDISPEGNGGVFSFTGETLVLTRAASATPDNGAGLIRYTDMAGSPQFVKVSFGYSLSGTTDSSTALDIELASLTSKGDYNNTLGNSVLANRLSLTGKGTGLMAYSLGGLTSSTINADGVIHQAAWYVNGTALAKAYVAPDGYMYQVSGYSSSLWIDGVLVFNDLSRGSYAGTSLSDFRIRSATTNPIIFSLTDFSIQEQSPTIVPDTPAPLQGWRQSVGLASDGSQDLQTPAGDGVSNLMKYALNMAPDAAALGRQAFEISPGGTSGLPHLDNQGTGALTFMFVRRKSSTNPGVTYGVEQSNNLTAWSAYLQAPLVEPVDSTWERVTYTLDPVTSPQSFLRLRVGTP
jgi:predicted heme/steroid binding protein